MKPLREVAIVFVLVMLVIWLSGTSKAPTWLLAVPAVMLLLNYWRNNPDSFKNLWKPIGKASHYQAMTSISMVFWIIIFMISASRNPEFWSRPFALKDFAVSVFFYLGNALWQQALVNGYFLPRLEEGFRNEWKSIFVLGLLFGIVHFPNPVLMPVTMIGGMLSAYFFLRTRNIYALLLVHAILAVSIMYFFPHSWHHHLRIGPGYFSCTR